MKRKIKVRAIAHETEDYYAVAIAADDSELFMYEKGMWNPLPQRGDYPDKNKRARVRWLEMCKDAEQPVTAGTLFIEAGQ